MGEKYFRTSWSDPDGSRQWSSEYAGMIIGDGGDRFTAICPHCLREIGGKESTGLHRHKTKPNGDWCEGTGYMPF